MDLEPHVELIAKKREKIGDTVRAPGVVWFLIIFMLILVGVSVSIFNRGRVIAPITSGSPSPEPDESTQSRIYTVSYKGGVFSPTNLRIRSGDTVRFKNDAFLPIHIASDTEPIQYFLPGFDSLGDVPAGSYFTFTFAAKGIFGYHNVKDPEEKGVIIVR